MRDKEELENQEDSKLSNGWLIYWKWIFLWPSSPFKKGNLPSKEILDKYDREFCDQMQHSSGHWNDNIAQDELNVLREHRRVDIESTLEEINAFQNEPRYKGLHAIYRHDTINRLREAANRNAERFSKIPA